MHPVSVGAAVNDGVSRESVICIVNSVVLTSTYVYAGLLFRGFGTFFTLSDSFATVSLGFS